MSQDTSPFPPIFSPKSELGALLFALLPCLRNELKPLASYFFHLTELSSSKQLPPIPPMKTLTDLDFLIPDKTLLQRSLSFYGTQFHMPLLHTLASLLQGLHFYHEYKDLLPLLFSGGSGEAGGFDFDILSTLFQAFAQTPQKKNDTTGAEADTKSCMANECGTETSDVGYTSEASTERELAAEDCGDVVGSMTPENRDPTTFAAAASGASTEQGQAAEDCGDPRDVPADDAGSSEADFHNELLSLLTPAQQELYHQLMHTT